MSRIFILTLWVFLYLCTVCVHTVFAFPSDTTASSASLKQIIIAESNNYFVVGKYKRLSLPHSLFAPELLQLKDFVLRRISFKDAPDPEFFYKLMEWVSLRWEHDGKNAPPENASTYQILLKAEKEHVQYRCQDYAQTLCDILHALGHVARVVSVQSSDVAYGSIGKGHVVVEVWSNSLGKWIFLDPQWCMYATNNNEILNFREIANLDSAKKFNEIQFVPSNLVLAQRKYAKDVYIEDYKKFIGNYFGTMQIPIVRNDVPQNLMLPLQNKSQYLTFQGLPLSKMIFTQHKSDVYFEVNRTSILLSYTHTPEWGDVFDNVSTPEEYMQKLPSVAAKPEFAVSCENSMPWFQYYMIRLNSGKWTKMLDSSYVMMSLSEGYNTVEAYSVNKAGIEGSRTRMLIFYGTEEDFAKSKAVCMKKRRNEQ